MKRAKSSLLKRASIIVRKEHQIGLASGSIALCIFLRGCRHFWSKRNQDGRRDTSRSTSEAQAERLAAAELCGTCQWQNHACPTPQ